MSPAFLGLLLAALPLNAGAASLAVSQDISPVTRVVELLQKLSKTIEQEEKEEEVLYNKFICWGKQVVSQKEASNDAAEARINELETYISDLDAGRIELTTERVDLEKEIKDITDELESMEAIRTKEHKDFLEAEDEMKKAIAALTEARQVLAEATKNSKEGVLLAVSRHVSTGGAESYTERSAELHHAADLADRFLGKGDALFLRRLLTGDVPTWDWKKLNRKATFKMSYKARSQKIQAILAKMQNTFVANLQEATDKEKEAQEAYDQLHGTKSGQLTAAKESLDKLLVENGARGLSREDATTELGALKTQVANDEKFIADTNTAMDTKKQEWKHRKELRAGELAAISKAIYILHNDDARDLFKKSFKSQGYALLQVRAESTEEVQARRQQQAAVAALQRAASLSGDNRLLSLAMLAKGEDQQLPPSNYTYELGANESVKTRFQPVIEAIDKMIVLLQSEEQEDLKIKEDCEKGRMEDTRDAILAARAIDEMTDLITRLQEEIKKLEAQIEELTEKKAQVQKELDEATVLREDEHRAWQKSDKDDKDAAAIVDSAKEVLASFYRDNGLVFAQKHGQPVVTVAGEAPPPPPSTWDAPYGGKVESSEGIVAVLELIHDDILKDIATALAAETEAENKYKELKRASIEEMNQLQGSIDEAELLKGNKLSEVGTTKTDRSTKKDELDAFVQKIKDVEPECDYFAINYQLRASNRHIELDGLIKAKAILMGGTFSEAPDPSRELKPGDAALIARSVQPRLRGKQ